MPVLPAVPSTTVPPGFNLSRVRDWRGNQGRNYAQAELLRILDYAQRRAILHTPSRVLELGLAVDVRAGLLRQSLEIDLS